MIDILEWLQATLPAATLRRSGTLYMVVNAAHILAIGLLVGAILPLDLRLAGFFRKVPVEILAPFLSRAAASASPRLFSPASASSACERSNMPPIPPSSPNSD